MESFFPEPGARHKFFTSGDKAPPAITVTTMAQACDLEIDIYGELGIFLDEFEAQFRFLAHQIVDNPIG